MWGPVEEHQERDPRGLDNRVYRNFHLLHCQPLLNGDWVDVIFTLSNTSGSQITQGSSLTFVIGPEECTLQGDKSSPGSFLGQKRCNSYLKRDRRDLESNEAVQKPRSCSSMVCGVDGPHASHESKLRVLGKPKMHEPNLILRSSTSSRHLFAGVCVMNQIESKGLAFFAQNLFSRLRNGRVHR